LHLNCLEIYLSTNVSRLAAIDVIAVYGSIALVDNDIDDDNDDDDAASLSSSSPSSASRSVAVHNDNDNNNNNNNNNNTRGCLLFLFLLDIGMFTTSRGDCGTTTTTTRE
jgi:hypothetical protein